MIGRADIEGSKSNVAMDAWLPQASYPCGNFSDTSCCKLYKSKGSIGHAFAVCIRTENQDQSTGQKSETVNVFQRPSVSSVLIRQSDSPCPYQF
ncbi:unnamed protein product [Bursaphelenchus okinawaensis]|uniref:Senescence-associated protein n=1 Tax=Bursaphelenchus okinawaensis TaxID=465554 RepID=A0A811JQ82_9BILA|nr:unnamed protein product [Bursaphelenchus okinawaensis]CAG9076800.1 unnamed protein product [Bursaphelenchus okinawaensis]